MRSKAKKTGFSVSFLKIIVLGVFALFAVLVCNDQTISLLKHSPYFKIKDIWYESSLKSIESSALANLKGKSLFSVDLTEIQKQLQSRYPQYKQLQVLKRFPNQVLVVARQRYPLARLRLAGKTLTLDEKGVILATAGDSDDQLPLIIGVNTVRGKITAGSLLESPDLRAALSIVRISKTDKILSNFRIAKIDVDNLSEINFYLANNLKVIVDQDQLEHQLKMLGLVLSQAKLDQENVKYIDLRFKEPILGKK